MTWSGPGLTINACVEFQLRVIIFGLLSFFCYKGSMTRDQGVDGDIINWYLASAPVLDTVLLRPLESLE